MSCNGCNQIPICKPAPFKIEKTACPDFFTEAGDIITYIYTVTYDASYPVTQIILNDDKVGSQSVNINNSGFCSSASVLLFQQFVSNYTITEADIQAGQPIINTATATIVFSDGSSITLSSVTATATFGQAFVVGTMYSYFDPIETTVADINLDINNAGPSKAKGVTVTLQYPTGITADDITLVAGNFILGTGSMSTFIDNIDPDFGVGFEFQMQTTPSISNYNWTGTIVTNTVNTNPDPGFSLLVQLIGHGPPPPICKPSQVTAEWQLTGPTLVTGASQSLNQSTATPEQANPAPEPPAQLPQPRYQVVFSMVIQPPGMSITSVTLVPVLPPPPGSEDLALNNMVVDPSYEITRLAQVNQSTQTFIFNNMIPPRCQLTINYSYTTPIGTVFGSQIFMVVYGTNVSNATIAQLFCVP